MSSVNILTEFNASRIAGNCGCVSISMIIADQILAANELWEMTATATPARINTKDNIPSYVGLYMYCINYVKAN
jgi:hypothetical protein